MVLGVALGSLGVLAFSSLFASAKAKRGSGVFSASSTTEKILENSKSFTEQYMNDTVVDSDSTDPFISSAEISRPKKGAYYKATGLDDEDSSKSPHSFGGGFLTGASVATFLDGSSGGREFPWLYLLVFGLGAYACYRLVK